MLNLKDARQALNDNATKAKVAFKNNPTAVSVAGVSAVAGTAGSIYMATTATTVTTKLIGASQGVATFGMFTVKASLAHKALILGGGLIATGLATHAIYNKLKK